MGLKVFCFCWYRIAEELFSLATQCLSQALTACTKCLSLNEFKFIRASNLNWLVNSRHDIKSNINFFPGAHFQELVQYGRTIKTEMKQGAYETDILTSAIQCFSLQKTGNRHTLSGGVLCIGHRWSKIYSAGLIQSLLVPVVEKPFLITLPEKMHTRLSAIKVSYEVSPKKSNFVTAPTGIP